MIPYSLIIVFAVLRHIMKALARQHTNETGIHLAAYKKGVKENNLGIIFKLLY